MGLISVTKSDLTFKGQTLLINKMVEKNHSTISIDTENYDNIQHTFMIQTPSKLGIEGVCLNLLKRKHTRTHTNT